MPSERLKEIFHLRAFNMENEIWKDIPNYEGHYQVSNFGRVRSLSKKMYKKSLINENILRCFDNSKGYLITCLTKNNKKKSFKVHQLVAMAFLNHIPNGLNIIIDHIDNNPLNNTLENLQLITVRENNSKDKNGYTSQYVGVCFDKDRNKWRSVIVINKKQNNLGRFDNEYDAHLAYQKALEEITK
jgi:hypothetical protein